MNSRSPTSASVLAIILASSVLAAGQDRSSPHTGATALAAKAWTSPKTPWGDPDLQGIYTSDDYMDTPLERPTVFGERLYFTEEELAEAAAKSVKQAEQPSGNPSKQSGPSRLYRGRTTSWLGRAVQTARASNVAHCGSAERKNASIDAGRSKETVADQANRYQSSDTSCIVEGV